MERIALESSTPSSDPVNCAVKNNPACVSSRAQRAIKVGRLGPRIVAGMPLITKPANSAAWKNLRWRASLALEGNMRVVILSEIKAAGNVTVALRSGGESVSISFLEPSQL